MFCLGVEYAASNDLSRPNGDAEKYGFRPATIKAERQSFSALPLDPLLGKATKLTVSVSLNG